MINHVLSKKMYLFAEVDYTLGDTMAKMNKDRLNVTLSFEAKQRAEELGATGEFGSGSNFVESAIWYYLGAREKNNELKYEECRKEMEKLKEECERNRNILLKILTSHPELIKEVNETKN